MDVFRENPFEIGVCRLMPPSLLLFLRVCCVCILCPYDPWFVFASHRIVEKFIVLMSLHSAYSVPLCREYTPAFFHYSAPPDSFAFRLRYIKAQLFGQGRLPLRGRYAETWVRESDPNRQNLVGHA